MSSTKRSKSSRDAFAPDVWGPGPAAPGPFSLREIRIQGATAHNLRNISCSIPLERLTVVCGPSGSGKSTLVFDVLARELRARFTSPFSKAARRERSAPAEVRSVDGGQLPVVLGGDELSRRPGATFGSLTGILRLLVDLWIAHAEQRCDRCGGELHGSSPKSLLDALKDKKDLIAWVLVPTLGPLTRSRAEHYLQLGLGRFLWDDERYQFEEVLEYLDSGEELYANALVFVDAVPLSSPDAAQRLLAACRIGCGSGDAPCIVRLADSDGKLAEPDREVSHVPWCPKCKRGVPRLTAGDFTSRQPSGACDVCHGAGTVLRFLEPSPETRFGTVGEWRTELYRAGVRGISAKEWASGVRSLRLKLETPLAELSETQWIRLCFGSLGRRLLPHWRCSKQQSEDSLKRAGAVDHALERCRRISGGSGARPPGPWLTSHLLAETCAECGGSRLGARGRRSVCGAATLQQWLCRPSRELSELVRRLPPSATATLLLQRLEVLSDLELGHLAVARGALELSGGEGRRAALVGQLGGGVERLLYLVDEPTIGLDGDTARLVWKLMRRLVDGGHTVVVIEHDVSFAAAADHLIQLGPGGGRRGGALVDADSPRSGTAPEFAPPPVAPRGALQVSGIVRHGLPHLSLVIPLGVLGVLRGPSGSGKTTALVECAGGALRELCRKGRRTRALTAGECEAFGLAAIEGAGDIRRIVVLPHRSGRAGYGASILNSLGVEKGLAKLYSSLPEAKSRGWTVSTFCHRLSPLGCEVCGGSGSVAGSGAEALRRCVTCGGSGFGPLAGEARFRGVSFPDLWQMGLGELRALFPVVPEVGAPLVTAGELGIEYLVAGEPASQLSEGEFQRVRLVRKLQHRFDRATILILDEPSRGLGDAEVEKLLHVLGRVRDSGATVAVIDHHELVARAADAQILLGAGGAERR